MNTEYHDRFWRVYWTFAAAGIALCLLVALLLIYTRPALSLETPPTYIPPEERAATSMKLP